MSLGTKNAYPKEIKRIGKSSSNPLAHYSNNLTMTTFSTTDIQRPEQAGKNRFEMVIPHCSSDAFHPRISQRLLLVFTSVTRECSVLFGSGRKFGRVLIVQLFVNTAALPGGCTPAFSFFCVCIDGPDQRQGMQPTKSRASTYMGVSCCRMSFTSYAEILAVIYTTPKDRRALSLGLLGPTSISVKKLALDAFLNLHHRQRIHTAAYQCPLAPSGRKISGIQPLLLFRPVGAEGKMATNRPKLFSEMTRDHALACAITHISILNNITPFRMGKKWPKSRIPDNSLMRCEPTEGQQAADVEGIKTQLHHSHLAPLCAFVAAARNATKASYSTRTLCRRRWVNLFPLIVLTLFIGKHNYNFRSVI